MIHCPACDLMMVDARGSIGMDALTDAWNGMTGFTVEPDSAVLVLGVQPNMTMWRRVCIRCHGEGRVAGVRTGSQIPCPDCMGKRFIVPPPKFEG